MISIMIERLTHRQLSISMIKPTRSKSVTIATRQSIDETGKGSDIQVIGTVLTILSPF
jgi:hypothetical protein